jgi:hypothetical protein
MRKFNFTKQLLAAALLVTTCLTSCQKTEMEDVNPFGASSVSAAADGSRFSDNLTVTINPNSVIEGNQVEITVSSSNRAQGTLNLEELIDGNWEILDGVDNHSSNTFTLTIPSVSASDNGRTFRAYLDKNGEDFYSSSLSLTVISTCEFSLTPTTTTTGSAVNGEYVFETTYRLQTCSRGVTGVKLQGGLTSGAVLIKDETTTGCTVKNTGKGDKGNTVITWDNINMGPNEAKTFKVKYTKVIACGVTEMITGAWSAKGLFADDNSPVLLGYNNRQQFTSNSCN